MVSLPRHCGENHRGTESQRRRFRAHRARLGRGSMGSPQRAPGAERIADRAGRICRRYDRSNPPRRCGAAPTGTRLDRRRHSSDRPATALPRRRNGSLDFSFALRSQRRAGHVVMTRTAPDPVDLGLRAIISRRANAHAFVSIHLNAFPDGVNPFVNNGSLTLYFWPHSIPLGMATQAALLAELGLRDNGTKFQNIAVARGTWMPSVLTEGAFVIMPDQEAAMRTPTYQEAYATAIVRGLESYFASLAQKQ